MFQRQMIVPIVFTLYLGILNYYSSENIIMTALLSFVTFGTFIIHEMLDKDAIYRRIFIPADRLISRKHVNWIDRSIYHCIKPMHMPFMGYLWRFLSSILHFMLILPVFCMLFWGMEHFIFTMFLLCFLGIFRVLLGNIWEKDAIFCYDATFFLGLGGLFLLCY